VLDVDSSGNVTSGKFSTTITAGGSGYAIGCLMTDTTTGKVAQNEGSATSCSFNVISDAEIGDIADNTITQAKVGDKVGGKLLIYNDTGAQLDAGTLVAVSSYDSTNGITVVKADANNSLQATHVVGADIADTDTGYVYQNYTVTALNTDSFSAIGDALYLSETAGEYTDTAPTAANSLEQLVGVVKVKSATVGEIQFSIQPASKIGSNELQAESVDSDNYVDGSVDNVHLSAPKVVFAQETIPVASFTDNLDATGTFATSISIPEGAIVTQAFIDELVGFAGDTSATITIGDGTAVDRYNTGTPSVFTTADHLSVGVPSGTAYHSAAKTVTLIITGASDFTSIVTEGNGTLKLTVAYYQSV